MKIHSMTATFGKLEHESLTLEPGLNVISAGNEWGKTTWCAFLTAMFYGLDTRAKSTKTALADKEHYAPWSGSPMSGRIDLNWQGRDITLERKSTGRTPMGTFRAYETETGLDIPEITARNCGERLLGVERSVFVRTGFIRFRDLAVTEDEALRRRLNSLVTTGDENSEADRLAEELKTLKNRIRHNRTGQLPQLEGIRDRLEEQRRELSNLENRQTEILRKLDDNEDWRRALENHLDALAHAASREDDRKVSQAEAAMQKAKIRYETWDSRCRTLPDRETARKHLNQINQLEDQLLHLQRKQNLGELSQREEAQIREKAREDAQKFEKLRKQGEIPVILGFMLLLSAIPLAWLHWLYALVAGVAGVGAVLLGLICKHGGKKERNKLAERYGDPVPAKWEAAAVAEAALRRENAAREEAMAQLRRRSRELSNLSRQDCETALSAWNQREDALEDARRAEAHYRDLKAMARTAKAPEFHDSLTYSREETLRLLEECAGERTRLEQLRGQCRGAMEAIGAKAELEGRLNQVNGKIRELENTYAALTIAQETLAEARQELQRRFAPGITRRTGQLMSDMTGGRYDRLRIGEDLSIWAGAGEEDTLFDTRWRSEGTVDQLFLSLRLAVAEAMLPQAPLILDDALARFDDTRTASAMEILKDMAQSRQVILFTCHSREKAML